MNNSKVRAHTIRFLIGLRLYPKILFLKSKYKLKIYLKKLVLLFLFTIITMYGKLIPFDMFLNSYFIGVDKNSKRNQTKIIST